MTAFSIRVTLLSKEYELLNGYGYVIRVIPQCVHFK